MGSRLVLWKQYFNLIFLHGATAHLSICLSGMLRTWFLWPRIQDSISVAKCEHSTAATPYVVTRVSSLFKLFMYLLCMYITVRVCICTCMCGGQRAILDIFLITIFGDKVSWNPKLPNLSRLTGQQGLGIPHLYFPKTGIAETWSFVQLLTRVPRCPGAQVRSCCLH